MENKKQSSVEWLYNTIDYEIVSYLDGEIDLNELSIAMLKLKEQAKAMHKEEMIDFGNDLLAQNDTTYIAMPDKAEYYYNITFGGNNE